MESTGANMPDIRGARGQNWVLKIVYIIISCLIIILLLFAVFKGIIEGDGIKDIFFLVWVMFFYILGVTLGLAFFTLNIISFIKFKSVLFFLLAVVSFVWFFSSVILIKNYGILP
jgi:hypothetical protein